MGGLHAVRAHIGGRVADRNLTVAASLDIGTHVAIGRLDIRGGQGGILEIVDDLVTGEEGHGVGVLRKGVDGGKDALQVRGVVGAMGIIAIDGIQRVVGIKDDVDARIREGIHALIMVLGVVGRVDADDIDTELLKLLDVLKADLWVGERVDVSAGATGLVVKAADVEALVALEEGIAFDGDGLDFSARLVSHRCSQTAMDGIRSRQSRHQGEGLHCEQWGRGTLVGQAAGSDRRRRKKTRWVQTPRLNEMLRTKHEVVICKCPTNE